MSDAVRDVYAGDDALADGAPRSPDGTFEFQIHADAEADVLCRVANQLNFANQPPWCVEMIDEGCGVIGFRVEMRQISMALAELIRRKLLQQTCVIDVVLRYVPAPRG